MNLKARGDIYINFPSPDKSLEINKITVGSNYSKKQKS